MIRPRSSLLPTDRRWPKWSEDRLDTRRDMYDAIKIEPRTAAYLAQVHGLPIEDTVDELRILEQFGVTRHRADDLGVIRWTYVPANKWETEPPPF